MRPALVEAGSAQRPQPRARAAQGAVAAHGVHTGELLLVDRVQSGIDAQRQGPDGLVGDEPGAQRPHLDDEHPRRVGGQRAQSSQVDDGLDRHLPEVAAQRLGGLALHRGDEADAVAAPAGPSRDPQDPAQMVLGVPLLDAQALVGDAHRVVALGQRRGAHGRTGPVAQRAAAQLLLGGEHGARRGGTVGADPADALGAVVEQAQPDDAAVHRLEARPRGGSQRNVVHGPSMTRRRTGPAGPPRPGRAAPGGRGARWDRGARARVALRAGVEGSHGTRLPENHPGDALRAGIEVRIGLASRLTGRSRATRGDRSGSRRCAPCRCTGRTRC